MGTPTLAPRTLFLVASLLLLIGACTEVRPQGSREKKPNIIVIVTDDQRARGTLSVMPVTTRLFRDDGVAFGNAVTSTPYCCPARASIFTGLYTHNHGVLRNMAPGIDLDHETTIQAYLKRAGYRVGMFGKYLNRWDISRDPPFFDEWAIFSRSRISGYYRGLWNVDGQRRRIRRYSTDYLARRSAHFVRKAQKDARPWALFISTGAPHPPFIVEPSYQHKQVPRWGGVVRGTQAAPIVRPCGIGLTDIGRIRRKQLRTLMSVDDLVERVFDVTSVVRGGADTLAFYLSDNGFLWGERGLIGKMSPYEMSLRVPLLMRWPGHVRPDADGRRASVVDIAPTILDAAGIRTRAPLDGRSLLEDWDRERAFAEYFTIHGCPSWASILTTSYQYVEFYGPDGKRILHREYYDLTGRGRTRNLLGDGVTSNDPEIDALSEQLARDRRCRPGDCP
jgi:arylsulfatase A-like enzyme